MAAAWPAAAGRPGCPAPAASGRPTGHTLHPGGWALMELPATGSGRQMASGTSRAAATPSPGGRRHHHHPRHLSSPRLTTTIARAREGRDLGSDDFFLADPTPTPPPLAVTEARGARLWEADLPTAWDIAVGTPARRFIPTRPGEVEDDDIGNLDWAAGVRDWPRFWALYVAWKFHLDARRWEAPRKDARAAPAKRPQAAWERAMGFAPPDGSGHASAALPPVALQYLDDLRKARGEDGEEEGAEGPPTALPAATTSADEEEAAAKTDGPTIGRLAKPPTADALAATTFWKEDGAFQAVLDRAVRIVHKQVPALLAAGVPVPEALPAYDAERSSATIFHDDPGEAAWEARWRRARDAVARPPPLDAPSPFHRWTHVEVRAWAAKRAAHDAADTAFAARQARVGAFLEADVSEHADIRMRRAVSSIPGFKRDWTHDEIMAVITNGGLSVHPDDAAPGVGITDPAADPDYWEEGIHQEPPLEEFLDGIGRLAGPGSRGPPELADPEGYGLAGPDGPDGGFLGGGALVAGGISPALAAEAAAAAAATPESISGMRARSAAAGGRAGGGGGSVGSDPLAAASEGAASSATLDEPFAEFDDLGGGVGVGGGSEEEEGPVMLDPAAESRPAGFDEDEDGDGEE